MSRYDSNEFEHNGRTYLVEFYHDNDHGAPWDEEDGHGTVSEWTTRDKLSGELVLASDRHSKRFYDFAETCRIAKRDGWRASEDIGRTDLTPR